VNVTVRDNPGELRYELLVDGDVAGQIRYTSAGDVLTLVHTDVSPSLEGEGLGGRLVRETLDDIRARGLGIVPLCPFVSSYVRRHPEYADLVTGTRDRR
jgi:predicted GNAT family acetyltransferase